MSEHNELLKLFHELQNIPRLGGETDEPEGTRYVQISDTYLRAITNRLSSFVAVWDDVLNEQPSRSRPALDRLDALADRLDDAPQNVAQGLVSVITAEAGKDP